MSATGTRLDPILHSVRERAAARRRARPLADLRREAQPDPARAERFVGSLARAAERDGLGFLAECKRASPSAGSISGEVDLLARARSYADGGAAAVSVLTEADHFAGDTADLAAVAPAGLPRLRKDFLLDEGMVRESVELGADAVLLMAVCLPGGLLGELREVARELGLATLLEAHDEAELERCLAVEPDLVGVNARDLRSFHVDVAQVERLLPLVPERKDGGPLRVAESGILGPAELHRVRAAGAQAALVGEALMRAGDPAATLRAWRAELSQERPA